MATPRGDSRSGRWARTRYIAWYSAATLGVVALFLLVREFGEQLSVPEAHFAAPDARAENTKENVKTLYHVLLAITAIIVVTRTMGALFRLVGQPLVIAEIIGGILLGPSLLGRISPQTSAYLFPDSIIPLLNVVAQLGMILYMFIVGLELDLGVIRKSGRTTAAIAHASIAAPFVLGAALALTLYTSMSPPGVTFTVFALFLGVSMSVTAFPVLARILTDRGVQKTPLGAIALTCAAANDAVAWCLLALVVSVAQASLPDAVRTALLTLVFVLVLLFIVPELTRRILRYLPSRTARSLPLVLVAMLSSALAMEYIGLHAIFGAFLLGLIVPHDSEMAKKLIGRLRGVVEVLFLPAFFAYTGLRTQIGLINGWDNWTVCGVIVLTACAGKFGGTYIVARLAKLPSREAAALGVLMNTRGLVELVVLNIGLDLGILTPTLFAMLVVMALVTTIMTTPLLAVVMHRRAWDNDSAMAQMPLPLTER